jgi:radical SAM-linked protein
MIRVRLTYKKGNSLKYTGHLDLHRVWERTLRRAQLPLAYSQGFHPQPRIQQACPLPLGFTSESEMLDIWLNDELTIETITAVLLPALHPGIEIIHIESIPLNAPPLQTIVATSDYRIQFNKPQGTPDHEKISWFLAQPTLMRERRGKPYDLRPLVHELHLAKEPHPSLLMCLSVLPGATGRPEEVLDVLGIDINSVQVIRTALGFLQQ